MFSCGMEFIILFVLYIMSGNCQAINMFGGICRKIGRWIEFRFYSMSVMDMYGVGFCILMKKTIY